LNSFKIIFCFEIKTNFHFKEIVLHWASRPDTPFLSYSARSILTRNTPRFSFDVPAVAIPITLRWNDANRHIRRLKIDKHLFSILTRNTPRFSFDVPAVAIPITLRWNDANRHIWRLILFHRSLVERCFLFTQCLFMTFSPVHWVSFQTFFKFLRSLFLSIHFSARWHLALQFTNQVQTLKNSE
jgi:hypothetical protein